MFSQAMGNLARSLTFYEMSLLFIRTCLPKRVETPTTQVDALSSSKTAALSSTCSSSELLSYSGISSVSPNVLVQLHHTSPMTGIDAASKLIFLTKVIAFGTFVVVKGYTLDSSSFHFTIQTIYTNAFTDLVRSLSITAITTRLPDIISVTLSILEYMYMRRVTRKSLPETLEVQRQPTKHQHIDRKLMIRSTIRTSRLTESGNWAKTFS